MQAITEQAKEPEPAYGGWNDREISRFLRRKAIFEREGFDGSERLAEQMLYRDRPDSGDDRRVCFECEHLAGRRCKAQSAPPLRFILQRCDFFKLKNA